MDRKPKKKLFIILTLIVICIIFFAGVKVHTIYEKHS